jgi:pyruvate-formate lyase
MNPLREKCLQYRFMESYKDVLDWLAELYVNTLNVIHYMHDKYAYEEKCLQYRSQTYVSNLYPSTLIVVLHRHIYHACNESHLK